MEISKIINGVEDLVSAGKTEEALANLTTQLDADPRFAELAQIARANQADLYTVKSQVLKGIISPEDARLATNQINNNVLELIERLKKGQFNLDPTLETPVAGRTVWRYYVAGGIVALALAALAWRFWGNAPQGECPVYTTPFRILVLPFLQTGDEQSEITEIDIAEDLNTYIKNTPLLRNRATVAVRKGFSMTKETYPEGFDQAAVLARECGVNMIIWGRLKRSDQGDYRLAVRYKIMGADGNHSDGNINLNNQFKIDSVGKYERDLKTATKYLYVAIANMVSVPIAMNLLEGDAVASSAPTGTAGQPSSVAMEKSDATEVDTALMLVLAANQLKSGHKSQAIETYSQILQNSPEHPTALQNRGVLLYETGNYKAAAEDLQAAAPDPVKADSALLKLRIESAAKSGQPVKAKEDLKVYRQKTRDGAWVEQKEQELRDSTKALIKLRNEKELAAQKKGDKVSLVGAARANISLGEYDRALPYARKATQKDPQFVPALEAVVDPLLAKNDTVGARKAIERAEKAGMNVKSVDRLAPVVKKLKMD